MRKETAQTSVAAHAQLQNWEDKDKSCSHSFIKEVNKEDTFNLHTFVLNEKFGF